MVNSYLRLARRFAMDAGTGALTPMKLSHGAKVEPSEGYVYHVTSPEHLPSIAKSGLVPYHPSEGMGSWEDGSTEKRVYFSKDPSSSLPSKDYPLSSTGSTKGAVLRHPQGAHVRPDRGGASGDMYTNKTIHPHELEYLHEAGHWAPLKSDSS